MAASISSLDQQPVGDTLISMFALNSLPSKETRQKLFWLYTTPKWFCVPATFREVLQTTLEGEMVETEQTQRISPRLLMEVTSFILHRTMLVIIVPKTTIGYRRIEVPPKDRLPIIYWKSSCWQQSSRQNHWNDLWSDKVPRQWLYNTKNFNRVTLI